MYKTRDLVTAALCLATALVLPFLIGQIPQIGAMLSPMHVPVLICGFLCGWRYGFIVGFLAPLLRSLVFGMPPLFPTATAMAFELAAYGLVSGLLYNLLPKKVPYIYLALVIAMITGRIVWGITMLSIMSLSGGSFTWAMFMAGAFLNAIPGIIFHLLVIPAFVIALQKAGFMRGSTY